MKPEVTILNLQTMNPFWRFVFAILGLGVLGLFIVFGLVMLAVFAAMAVVAGIVVSIRAWWLGRKLPRAGAQAPPGVYEGEFIVVERRTLSAETDAEESQASDQRYR
ncbi:MAG: hypothetical protein AAGE01_18185 [Pseudomonadota bacterium]